MCWSKCKLIAMWLCRDSWSSDFLYIEWWKTGTVSDYWPSCKGNTGVPRTNHSSWWKAYDKSCSCIRVCWEFSFLAANNHCFWSCVSQYMQHLNLCMILSFKETHSQLSSISSVVFRGMLAIHIFNWCSQCPYKVPPVTVKCKRSHMEQQTFPIGYHLIG